MKKRKNSLKAAPRKKDGWVLYSGMYEIKWKNGVADEVCIENVILKIKPWKPRQAKKLFA